MRDERRDVEALRRSVLVVSDYDELMARTGMMESVSNSDLRSRFISSGQTVS